MFGAGHAQSDRGCKNIRPIEDVSTKLSGLTVQYTAVVPAPSNVPTFKSTKRANLTTKSQYRMKTPKNLSQLIVCVYVYHTPFMNEKSDG